MQDDEAREKGFKKDFEELAKSWAFATPYHACIALAEIYLDEPAQEGIDFFKTYLPGTDIIGLLNSWRMGFQELEEFRIEKVGEDLEFEVKAPGLSAAVVITVKKPKE